MHITISGKLGSGKSTVCKILCAEYGFEKYSTGDVQRAIAEKMGISTLEMNNVMWKDKSFDYMIDDAVAEISEKCTDKLIVFDSRMAWHFAKNSFRVFLYVEPTEAGNRVFLADRGNVEKYSSPEEARDMLIERSMNENRRFKEIYNVDNYEYSNYDLVIDTTMIDPEEVVKLIYAGYTEFCKKPFDSVKVILCPYSVFPGRFTVDSSSEKPVITRMGHSNVVIGNADVYVDALKNGARTVECEYVVPNGDFLSEKLPVEVIKKFELENGVVFKLYPDIYI